MKSILILTLLLSLSSCATKKKINQEGSYLKVVHYNIKELTTEKIQAKPKQLQSVRSILSKFDIDILSINEIQYDLENIPTTSQKTIGKNLESLGNYLGLEGYSAIFFEANTGKNAKKKKNGNYYRDYSNKDSRHFADKDSFGIFPGQYSSGVLIKNDIEVRMVRNISKIKWREFNKNISLNEFANADGSKVNKDILLFDKNLTDITVRKDGHLFHIILLHTVPAFHFGNKKTVNYARNRDQLRFLEWYLTGKTDIKVNLKNILPLEKGSSYIALGDWNTELNHKKNPGSKVLRRLEKKGQFWLKSPIAHTNESGSFHQNRMKLQLDYIYFSKNFKSIHAGIYSPTENRKDLGCEQIREGEMIRSFYDKEKKKKCYSKFSKDFLEMKEASDHLPIWVNLELRAN